MTTREQLNDSFDAMAEKALRVKRERDELLEALKAMLDCEYGSPDAYAAVRMARRAVKRAEGRA